MEDTKKISGKKVKSWITNNAIIILMLVIVIAVNPENNYIDVDAGIAVQSLALAAKALGLESVIMAAPDRVFTGPRAQEYERLLGFPAGYRFAIALAVGYAAREFRPHEHKRENMIELC